MESFSGRSSCSLHARWLIRHKYILWQAIAQLKFTPEENKLCLIFVNSSMRSENFATLNAGLMILNGF